MPRSRNVNFVIRDCVNALKHTGRRAGVVISRFGVSRWTKTPKINNTNAGGKNNFTSGEV